jgi:hypothetical protein
LIPTILGLLTLVVGVPLNLYVTLRLWRLSSEKPLIRVLRERAIVATVVLIVVTIFGLIFLNNDLVPPVVTFDDTKVLTRGAMLLVAIIPAAYWLYLYRR